MHRRTRQGWGLGLQTPPPSPPDFPSVNIRGKTRSLLGARSWQIFRQQHFFPLACQYPLAVIPTSNIVIGRILSGSSRQYMPDSPSPSPTPAERVLRRWTGRKKKSGKKPQPPPPPPPPPRKKLFPYAYGTIEDGYFPNTYIIHNSVPSLL